ncbi:MAG: glutathione S-transferase family protein [Deltaproteobacteria bacterium]|nr:glutathione S-transferase family protein [Deltaproteobacteria bacterium]
MLTLYTSPMSGNGRKVHTVLEEVGAQYQLVKLDLTKGDQKKPDYLRLNPNGKVPTINDDGFILWESNAIIQYLAEKFPTANLLASGAQNRARMFQWLLFEQTTFRPPLSLLMRQLRFTPPDKQDATAIEQLWSEVRTNMGILQNALSGRDYIGETFSVADIAVLPYIYLAKDLGADLSAWPTVDAYWQRLSARPSWQKIIAWKG